MTEHDPIPEPDDADDANPVVDAPRVEPADIDPAPLVELGLRPQHHGARMIAGTELAVVPPMAEMEGLAQLAVTLSAAGSVPKALQNRPNDVLLIFLTARDLGVALTTAIREFHVIDGKVTISPKAKMAMVRQQRLGRIWPHEDNGVEAATWYGERNDMPGTVVASTFTMEDAKRAGGLLSKQNWKAYPARMLSWRALGHLIDDLFGEVATGLYSPDEIGATTDEDGSVVIDTVAHADPFPGHAAPRGRRSGGQAEEEPEVASEGDRAGLRTRIHGLPDGAKPVLAEAWVGEDRDNPRMLPLDRLLARQVAKAAALIDSFEVRAAKGEWGPWSPESPQEPSDGVSGTDTPPDAPEGATGAGAAVSGAPEPSMVDVEYAIELVQAMDWPQVQQELEGRGMSHSGTRAQRKAELAQRMARELADAAAPVEGGE